MQVVRLVKTSDLQQVTELIKKTGIGMTTMPKNRKEVQERIAWSVKSANKKSANPNKDTYLFVLENQKKVIGISAIYTSVSKEKPSVFFKLKKLSYLQIPIILKKNLMYCNCIYYISHIQN